MAKTLQQVIGAENLVGVIQAVKPGLPQVLPDQFMTITRRVTGNTATYMKVEGNRRTARLVQYGSPSIRRSLKGVSEVSVVLMHSLENYPHKPSTLMNLKAIGSEIRQKMGRDEIARQTGEFKRGFTNLRQSAAVSAFALGAIYFDGDGNLLPSSASAVTIIGFQIPAGNQDQCDILGGGDVITGKWSAAASNIHKQLEELQLQVLKNCGYQITEAFYGKNILDYFLGNTKLKEIIFRNAGMQQAFTSGMIPNGFLDLNWHPIHKQFYEDADGSYQTMVGDNLVIFTPAPTPDWWEFVEGSYPVPTDLGTVAQDAAGILDSAVAETFGMFSYAYQTPDPSTIVQIAGDTALPLIKVPKAVVQATVHW